MSNSRSTRRKVTGKSGGSPGKSKRRQRQQYQAAMERQASLDRLTAQVKTVGENFSKAFQAALGTDEDPEEPTPE